MKRGSKKRRKEGFLYPEWNGSIRVVERERRSAAGGDLKHVSLDARDPPWDTTV